MGNFASRLVKQIVRRARVAPAVRATHGFETDHSVVESAAGWGSMH